MELLELLPACWERMGREPKLAREILVGVNDFCINGFVAPHWGKSFVSSIDGYRYTLKNKNATVVVSERGDFIKVYEPNTNSGNVDDAEYSVNSYYIDTIGRASVYPTQSGADFYSYCHGDIKLEDLTDKYFLDPLFYLSVLKNEENQFNSYYWALQETDNLLNLVTGINNYSVDTKLLDMRATITQDNLCIAKIKRNIAQNGIHSQEIAVLEKYISQKNNLQKRLEQYSTVKNMSDTRQQVMGSFLREYVSLEKEFETKDIPQCVDGLSLPTLK